MDFNVRFEEYVNELVTDCKIYSMSGRQAFCQALWDTGSECSVMFIGPIRVMEGQYDSDIILIGMDIIGSGDLIVTNNSGHTEMAFTIPSFLIIDNIMNMKN